jgi:hypothetical protein
MMAEALVSAGCYYDDKYREVDFSGLPDLIVARRSFPHHGEWVDAGRIIHGMWSAQYKTHVLFMVRDWNATRYSIMQRRKGLPYHIVEKNMVFAMEQWFYIPTQNKVYVSYEAFCLSPGFRKWLFTERLGLPEPTIEIKYGNNKYYEGETL